MFAAMMVLFGGGLGALVVGRDARRACRIGPLAAVVGCGLAAVQPIDVLLHEQIVRVRIPWHVPLGSLSVGLDPLSAVFALVIAFVCALAALYGSEYLEAHGKHKNLGVCWFLYNLLVASMLAVVVARNAVLFLVAWELMSWASFFLVMFEGEQEQVRRAGWTYLVATHLGTALLLAMFTILGRGSPLLDFGGPAPARAVADVVFVLALIGFGTKAGLVPLHVWLPEAHPAAPSHVSAVMSGVMLKTGIYGLLRTLTWLGPPPPWWGWTMLGVGTASAILGVLLALTQGDLKRLLAYSSVENVGIIALGIGLGLLGISYRVPAMAVLGLCAALLHVVNHALFKSLLFLGAGAVLHATGTRDMDRLGGLGKRMPHTAVGFLIGAAAISGLPPLNGFVSELLIYVGALAGLASPSRSPEISWPLLTILVVGGLALVGGLAAAGFTKAFGIVFLGEPRSDCAAKAREVGPSMRAAMLLLAAGCMAVAAVGPRIPDALRPAVETLLPIASRKELLEGLTLGNQTLGYAWLGSVVLVVLIALAAVVRWRLLAGRKQGQTGTWDCGYAAPTPRMQYTASSYAHPLVHLFRVFVRSHEEIRRPQGLFPSRAELHTETPDVFQQRLYGPVFLAVSWAAARLRWFQQGRIQLYVLYIALTLLVLMVWKLG
jgi:formate hydrogenlyase subunit 3/multisubunit Na+/H+ antiporter MnhD subunit